ncbi:MAG: sulfide/dihydroorotate dehydrogenase-like FAD/NAD-binding protein [Myxococcota bacterium]
MSEKEKYGESKHTLLEVERIAPLVTRYVISAPHIAKQRKAGQFVIVRTHKDSERIPLTIADADEEKGTITLIAQEVGKSTARMADMKVGDELNDVAGPLGNPTHIENFGTVVVIGGGIGIAPSHPIAQALKKAGNRVVSILGARTKELLIMEKEMRAASDMTIVCTDDGSYGKKGLVTQILEEYINEYGKPDMVVGIGPLIMMDFVCRTTKKWGLPTVVSLNPIMVDGTGMCGGCRVTVGGKVKFVCVDGPEFDGHGVNFKELASRQSFYKQFEKLAYDDYLKRHPDHKCKLDEELAKIAK